MSIENNTADKVFKVTNIDDLNFADLKEFISKNEFEVSQDSLDEDGWSLLDNKSLSLINKIKSSGISLKEYSNNKIFYGIKTGLNEAFVIDSDTRSELIKADPRSAELIKPFLAGKDIKRYEKPENNKYLIFTRRGVNIKNYPAIEKYLFYFKDRLQPKPKNYTGSNWKGRKPGNYKWYEIQDTVEYYLEFENNKIIIPAISNKANYCFDTERFYSNDKTSIIPTDDKYLLGLLNSKLLDFFLKSIAATKRGGYFEYKPMYLSVLPIKTIESDYENIIWDRIIALVEQMLETQNHLFSSKIKSDQKHFQQKADLIDNQINQLVYELYDLTEEEIEIIEKH